MGELLQLYCVNMGCMKRMKLEAHAVKFQQYHWGTQAFLINRAGMKKLVDLGTMPIDPRGVHRKKYGPGSKPYVADLYIYRTLVSYTATRPYVNLHEFESTIHKGHTGGHSKVMNTVNEWWYNDYSKQFETYKPSAAKRAAHEAAKTAWASKAKVKAQPAAEKVAKEKAVKVKAQQDKVAKEKAVNVKAQQDEVARLKAVNVKAQQDGVASLKAVKVEAQQDETAKEQAAEEKAQQDKVAKEKAVKEKAQQDEVAKEKAVKVKAQQDEVAKEKAAEESLMRDSWKAVKIREKAAKEKAANNETLQEKSKTEKTPTNDGHE